MQKKYKKSSNTKSTKSAKSAKSSQLSISSDQNNTESIINNYLEHELEHIVHKYLEQSHMKEFILKTVSQYKNDIVKHAIKTTTQHFFHTTNQLINSKAQMENSFGNSASQSLGLLANIIRKTITRHL